MVPPCPGSTSQQLVSEMAGMRIEQPMLPRKWLRKTSVRDETAEASWRRENNITIYNSLPDSLLPRHATLLSEVKELTFLHEKMQSSGLRSLHPLVSQLWPIVSKQKDCVVVSQFLQTCSSPTSKVSSEAATSAAVATPSSESTVSASSSPAANTVSSLPFFVLPVLGHVERQLQKWSDSDVLPPCPMVLVLTARPKRTMRLEAHFEQFADDDQYRSMYLHEDSELEMSRNTRFSGGRLRILISTPAKVAAFLAKRYLKLDTVSLVVVERMNRMSRSTLAELEKVMNNLPEDRITLLHSTASSPSERLAALQRKFTKDPVLLGHDANLDDLAKRLENARRAEENDERSSAPVLPESADHAAAVDSPNDDECVVPSSQSPDDVIAASADGLSPVKKAAAAAVVVPQSSPMSSPRSCHSTNNYSYSYSRNHAYNDKCFNGRMKANLGRVAQVVRMSKTEFRFHCFEKEDEQERMLLRRLCDLRERYGEEFGLVVYVKNNNSLHRIVRTFKLNNMSIAMLMAGASTEEKFHACKLFAEAAKEKVKAPLLLIADLTFTLSTDLCDNLHVIHFEFPCSWEMYLDRSGFEKKESHCTSSWMFLLYTSTAYPLPFIHCILEASGQEIPERLRYKTDRVPRDSSKSSPS